MKLLHFFIIFFSFAVQLLPAVLVAAAIVGDAGPGSSAVKFLIYFKIDMMGLCGVVGAGPGPLISVLGDGLS